MVEDLKNIVVKRAAVGKNHTLFLTENHEVYGCGDNKSGQCGIGKNSAIIYTPTKINFKEGPVRKVILLLCLH